MGFLRTCTLLCMICLGILLRKIGVLGPAERHTLSKLLTSVTLPAVILSSYRGIARDVSLLWLIPLGLAVCLCMMTVCVLSHRRLGRQAQAFAAINGSSVSISAFTLLFLQGYLSTTQLIPVIFFEVGNGCMAFGGTAAAGQALLNSTKKAWPRTALKTLFSSVPVQFHLLALLLYLTGLKLPEEFYEGISLVADAQPLIGMLLLGCSIQFPKYAGGWRRLGRLLAIHYATVAVLAVLLYFLLPYGQTTRAVIVVILFSPLALGGLVATDTFGLDLDLAGLLNSITILIGIAAVLFLIPMLGIGSAAA